MGTFVAGYTIVWLAVVLYVGRLGRRQQRLRREIEILRSAWPSPDGQQEPPARAA